MSYLVFALGLLLALCGAYAVYFGYGIIAVERGWASVIAGATALSCGIVTIALGFVLRGLAQMRIAIGAGKSPRTPPRNPPPGRTANEPRAAGRVERLEPALEPALFEEAAPEPEAPLDAPEEREREPAAAPPETRRALDAVVATRHAPPIPPRVRPDVPKVSRASIEDVRRLVAQQLERKPPAEFEPAVRRGYDAAPEAAPERLDEGDAASAPEPRNAPPPVPSSRFPGQPPAPELPSAAAEAPSDPPPRDDPKTVVGRYESDGTSYVMYADGSIDARSERGAFHFQSMAELKAFLDRQE